MQTLSKMAKIPKSKSNWDNAGVVFIQKAITICDSNWKDGNRTKKKGKKYVFKTLSISAMKIEKKSKTYLLIVLSPAKEKKSNLKISSKSIRTDWKLIKTDQKTWSETDQKLMSPQKSFLSFLFPPKNNAFLQVIFMKSEKIILESRKRTSLESYQ